MTHQPQGSLPAELTSFVGRRRQIGEVKRLLAAQRLVTLTGVGGTGKTRLALRVAAEVRRAFTGGVWFIDLTLLAGPDMLALPAADPDALAHLIAAALGRRERPAGSPLRTLADQLSGQQLLLVLDNCEHVVQSCAAVADGLLRSCADLRILATSRDPLAVAGEALYPVPPLPVPDPRNRPGLAEVGGCPSVALFVARAAMASPGFRLDRQNCRAVAELCHRLEGLPLAIELAASWVRVLEPAQILERTSDRFALLAGGGRSSPRRQQSLRACVEWSFDLCTAPEQLLWSRLAVFAGGFQLDSVEGVCADRGLPVEDILDLLATLIDRSVVLRDDGHDRARYRMLETIRAYGMEKLTAAGEEPALRRRHADWHLHLAERAEQNWFGPEQDRWCRRMRSDHANLRLAFDYYLAAPDGKHRGLRLAGVLWFYWLVFGLAQEGRDWLRRATGNDLERSPDLARALWIDGHLASVQGDLDAADRRLESAHELAGELGDELTRARAVKRLGAVAMHRGDHDRADALLTDALARLEVLDAAGASAAHARIALAMNCYLRGDYPAASRVGTESRAVCQARGDRYLLAHTLNNLARTELALGRWEPAVEYLREALQLQRTLPDAMTLVFSLDLLSESTAAAGDYQRAATLIGAARGRWQPLGRSVHHWEILADRLRLWEMRTRTALGGNAFAAAVRHGATLGIDETISYALAEHDEPAPGPDKADPALTRREAEIAELIALGMSNKQIAGKLVIGLRTAESHVEHILRKLGLVSRTQVAAWYSGRDQDR